MKERSFAPEILLLGPTGVGKTALLKKASGDEFNPGYSATQSPHYREIPIKLKEKNVCLQCKDSPGQDRFGLPSPLSLEMAKAIILVFDLTDLRSFKKLADWKDLIVAPSKPLLILVGNKSDGDNQQVTREQINTFIEKHSPTFGTIEYFETSAKNGTNVNELFQRLAELTAELLLKQELKSLLRGYISKIKQEKTPENRTVPDFTFGFRIFRESRGMSQEANFYLAQALLKRLNDGASVADAFKDIDAKRDQIITEKVNRHYSYITQFINYIIRHLSPINSKQLNAIINKAASAASRSPSPKV